MIVKIIVGHKQKAEIDTETKKIILKDSDGNFVAQGSYSKTAQDVIITRFDSGVPERSRVAASMAMMDGEEYEGKTIEF